MVLMLIAFRIKVNKIVVFPDPSLRTTTVSKMIISETKTNLGPI